MQVTAAIATSVLTSAVVAAAVSALLKHVFDKRLLRMEKHLDAVYDALREREQQRGQIFERFAGTVHEVRNLAREIAEHVRVEHAPLGVDALAGLRPALKRLERDIYGFRLTLEVEGVFQDIHAFKNVGKAFVGLVRDLLHEQAQFDGGADAGLIDEVLTSYDGLDLQYTEIIERLTQVEVLSRSGLAIPVLTRS